MEHYIPLSGNKQGFPVYMEVFPPGTIFEFREQQDFFERRADLRRRAYV